MWWGSVKRGNLSGKQDGDNVTAERAGNQRASTLRLTWYTMGILRREDLSTQTCLGSPKHVGRGVPAGEWPGDKLRKFKSS